MSDIGDIDPWDVPKPRNPPPAPRRSRTLLPTENDENPFDDDHPSFPTTAPQRATRKTNFRIMQNRDYDGVILTESEFYEVMAYNGMADILKRAHAKGEDWIVEEKRKALQKQIKRDLREVKKRLQPPNYPNSPLHEHLQHLEKQAFGPTPHENEEEEVNEDPLDEIDIAPDGPTETTNEAIKRQPKHTQRNQPIKQLFHYSPNESDTDSEEEERIESRRYRSGRKESNQNESVERQRRSAKRKLAKTLFEGIPKYSGTYGDERSFRVFVAAAEEWADVQEDLNEKDALKSITSLFRGEASEWWMNHKEQYSPRDRERINTFDALKIGLKERFLPAVNYSRSKAEYRNCKQTGNVSDYINDFTKAVSRLPPMSEVEKIYDFVENLRPKVKADIQTRILEEDYSRYTLRKIQSIAVQFESARFPTSTTKRTSTNKRNTTDGDHAFATKEGSSRGRGGGRGGGNRRGGSKTSCFTCGKEGHRQSECTETKGACFTCQRTGHQSKECFFNPDSPNYKGTPWRSGSKNNSSNTNKSNLSNQPTSGGSTNTPQTIPEVARSSIEEVDDVAFVAGEEAETSRQWWLDSCASSLITYQREDFDDFASVQQHLVVGDNRLVPITGRGTVTIKTGSNSLTLPNVAFVPTFKCKLISGIALDEAGCEYRAKDGVVTIFDEYGGELFRCERRKGTKEAFALALTSLETWHRRFGHINSSAVKKTKALVDGMEDLEMGSTVRCEACLLGKHHRSSFPPSNNRPTKPMEEINSDLCGPWPTRSLGGHRYFVTYIDGYSGFTTVTLLKNKSDQPRAFKNFKAWAEKLTGHHILRFRSDGGGEYNSTEFQTWLREEGIEWRWTTTATPQSNGISERMNQTIQEGVRAMLIDANLPDFLWGEAVQAFVFLRNRSSTTTTPTPQTTPYEAFLGHKPDVSMLRVYGCIAYAHSPSTHTSKLDARGIKCQLVGYGQENGQKAWRLYNLQKRNILVSRDVYFDEHNTVQPTQNITPRIPRPKENPPKRNAPTNQPPIRRSARIAARKVTELAIMTLDGEPEGYRELVKVSETERKLWEEAMKRELTSLEENCTWEIVDQPNNANLVDSKWVFKIKRRADGTIDKYKARLVARGFTQTYGIDFDQTYAPVAKLKSIRILVAFALHRNWNLYAIDIVTAYLNSHLQHSVYMLPPDGLHPNLPANKVLLLRKGLYGLRQGAYEWHETLDGEMLQLGMKPLEADSCVYIDEEGELVVLVYVDDMIVTGTEDKCRNFKQQLQAKFKANDLGQLTWYMGIEFLHHTNGIALSQRGYIQKALKRFGLHDANPSDTPASTTVDLVPANANDALVNKTVYQQMVGTLIWLTQGTRPDIANAVQKVTQFAVASNKQHETAVKRIFRYLKGTINMGIEYSKSNDTKLTFEGYSDSDWAGDKNDRRSTAGYLFKMNGKLVSWQSKKQQTVALSTVEAEYLALTEAAKEAAWLRFFANELQKQPTNSIVINYDNRGAGQLALNPVFHARTKHIEIRHHYIRETQQNGTVHLKYVPTTSNIADVLTKPLPKPIFDTHRTSMGVTILAEVQEETKSYSEALKRSEEGPEKAPAEQTSGEQEQEGTADVQKQAGAV